MEGGQQIVKHFLIQVCAISGNSKDFFGELKPHAKFHNPRTTLSGKKVCVGGWWLRVNLVLRFGPNLWVGLWDLALDQTEQKLKSTQAKADPSIS